MSYANYIVIALSCLTGLLGCSLIHKEPVPDLAVVPRVEIERYLGTWYEIARYPNRFQKECVAVTADYSLRDDGKIRVVNTCHKGGPDGPMKSIEGKAWVVDRETNAKLKVQFFWPFQGAYWIIDLGTDYDYAVVGHPTRKYLWILSRSPEMEPTLYQAIVRRLVEHGYEPARLQKTLQPAS
jgi:apolipoprotein D and lipocalin family protein